MYIYEPEKQKCTLKETNMQTILHTSFNKSKTHKTQIDTYDSEISVI